MPILNGFPDGDGAGKYLPLTGGMLSGNLTLKGSGNFGTKINFGDGDYVHISEPTDDNMEIKAKSVSFVTTASPGLTMSGDLNMGSKKITNLAAGTASTDAVTYAQLLNAVAIPSHTTTLSHRVGSITLVWTPFGVFFTSGNYINEVFSISDADITSIEAVISSVLPGFTISRLSCKCSYYNNSSLSTGSIEISSAGNVVVNTYTHGFFVYTSF